MTLVHRLQELELEFIPKVKVLGCNPCVFVVVPEDMRQGAFDCDSYRPTEDETEKYLKDLKDGGQCQDCKGSCAIDWAPDGFKNFSHTGQGGSSSVERQVHFMFCANAEIPVLTRRIMNGERTG
jgi:hypothetical protein